MQPVRLTADCSSPGESELPLNPEGDIGTKMFVWSDTFLLTRKHTLDHISSSSTYQTPADGVYHLSSTACPQ